MADSAESSGFIVPIHSHANNERTEPGNDSALARGCQDLAALVALHEAELRVLRVLDESEAQQAGSGENEAVAHRALGAVIDCSTLVWRLIRSPASSPSGVFAKIEAFFAVLGTAGLDEEMLLSFGHSIRDDIARISPSGLPSSIERPDRDRETVVDVLRQNGHSRTSDMRSAR